MSDRVAVFHKGKIEQVASPRALYDQPRTVFVASFVGTANIFDGPAAQQLTGRSKPVALRPEHLHLGAPASEALSVTGRVKDVQFHGPVSRVAVEAQGVAFVVSVPSDRAAAQAQAGQEVQVWWAREHMVELEAA